VVTADVMDPVAIAPDVDGADAVLSALGPRGSGPTSISEDSTRSIIEAMEKSGSRRLMTITGSIVDDTADGFLMRRVIKPLARRTFLRNVCTDMRRAEDLIHASNLDWTIFRPPRLTDKPASGSYRTAIDRNPPRGVTISRADLAAEMLEHLDDPGTWHKHVFVAN
jgi:putative NADH-flavin reductase